MGTTNPGEVTITPIVWTPPGFTAPSVQFVSHLAQFDSDVVAANGTGSNVLSTLTEYTDGTGTHLSSLLHAATPIASTDAMATTGVVAGETVVGCSHDTGQVTGVEGDHYSYSGCVTDVQIMAEVEAVRTRLGLADDASHLYPVFLPKGVESCFGSLNGQHGGECSLNASSTSSQYCAYHSSVFPASGAVYSVQPFPTRSVTGGSCDLGWVVTGAVQSPSGDVAFDSVASSFSHEIAEAITDPFGDGWFDAISNENGDECAYSVPSVLDGSAGANYDQTINGHHYLLQTEFSNLAYSWNQSSGCLTSASIPAPTVTALSATTATVGDQVTITGTSLAGAPIVKVHGQTATVVTSSDTSVVFAVPSGATSGPVSVQTIAGTATTPGSLTVATRSSPAFTSSGSFAASVEVPMSAIITTTGFPFPSISTASSLPGGLVLTDNGNGTATLAGTPQSTTSGSWPVVLSAHNGAGTATQSATIEVHAGAAIISAPTAAFVAATSGSFTITTSGTPSATVSLFGSLPTGLVFSAHGDGTATIAGLVRKAKIGSYPVTIRATNGVGSPDTKQLTVVVGTLPKVMAQGTVGVLGGRAFSVSASSTGTPTPTLSVQGLEWWMHASASSTSALTITGTAPTGGVSRSITLTLQASSVVGTISKILVVHLR